MNNINLNYLDTWVQGLLANPITKLSTQYFKFPSCNGILDGRVFLKNTYGYEDWSLGQKSYEDWESTGAGYRVLNRYKDEIENDKSVYEHFKISGDIVDVGGGAGTLREFLGGDCRYLSVDPFISSIFNVPNLKKQAYDCLNQEFNFISGVAEFLPLVGESFDWVHMRSMLDHVQVPDLALIEANRVLKNGGSLLVGLYVEGGRSGKKTFLEVCKEFLKQSLSLIGIDKYRDMHTWHPSFVNLQKLIEDANFKIIDIFWQPCWKDRVVYIHAKKQLAESAITTK
jgi:ubiquinone/menaquinone biosynthesis C-methylase UbiE